MLVSLEHSGAVGILRMQRAARANALNRQLLEELAGLQESLRADRETRVLITVGEGKGFSAGSDLEELARLSIEDAVDHQLLEGCVCRAFLSLPQPVIAAVHGYAMGGGLFLAAYHDFRVIAGDARLGCPEVKLGWNPTFGTSRLAELVGAGTAARWVMTGEEFTTAEAEREGFATCASETGDALREAVRFAGRLVNLPAAGLAAIKESFWRTRGREFERADALDAESFGRCFGLPPSRASLLRYTKVAGNKAKGQ